MMRTEVVRDPRSADFEPAYQLLSNVYFKHASGSAYALSQASLALLTSLPAARWRSFAHEDVSVGAWALALDIEHRDDRRLCSDSCTQGIVLWDGVPTHPSDAAAHMRRRAELCQFDEQHVNEAQLVEAALQQDADSEALARRASVLAAVGRAASFEAHPG